MSAPRVRRLLVAAAVVPFAVALAWAVLALPTEPAGLTAAVMEEIPTRPVSQPVTAVLLDFRAYDTWLEVVVLLLAAIGALAVRRTHDLADAGPPGGGSPILQSVARLITPVMILLAGYLLWLGTHAPGGAFQAGAVLGAAAVLGFHAGLFPAAAARGLALRALLGAGTLAFLAAAVIPLARGRAMLTTAPGSGWIILLLEAFVALAIGATLAALFLAARPADVAAADPFRAADDGAAHGVGAP